MYALLVLNWQILLCKPMNTMNFTLRLHLFEVYHAQRYGTTSVG
jgi:hypothetical protein